MKNTTRTKNKRVNNFYRRGNTSRTDPKILFPEIISMMIQQTEEQISKVEFKEVGTVQQIGNGVARVSGLSQIGIDELVIFPNGVQGLTIGLNEQYIEVILLGSEEGIFGGDVVTTNRERLTIPVGWNMLGKVINTLGISLKPDEEIEVDEYRTLDRRAPRIIDRAPVNAPLHTGLRVVDALFPIGKGQRELIIGDRQTGKTSMAIDTILNQRGNNVQCIYVSIGQKISDVINTINILRTYKALDYTTIIVASPDDPPALRYLAPYAGCTIAEFFLDNNQDSLIIYDDLSKHAQTYREISLLLRRPPGREAYPGDIFYLHSRLLERACKLNPQMGGGSITALPIIVLEEGNISGYIPTNLISICDGQIVFDKELFNRDIKPAINIGLSISRVGNAAQIPAMRNLSSDLRLELTQYSEVEKFARFGTEVDKSTKEQIERGRRLQEILNQQIHQPMPIEHQVLLLLAANTGFFEDIEIINIVTESQSLISYLIQEYTELVQKLQETQEIDDSLKTEFIVAFESYKQKENTNE